MLKLASVIATTAGVRRAAIDYLCIVFSVLAFIWLVLLITMPSIPQQIAALEKQVKAVDERLSGALIQHAVEIKANHADIGILYQQVEDQNKAFRELINGLAMRLGKVVDEQAAVVAFLKETLEYGNTVELPTPPDTFELDIYGEEQGS